MSKFAPYFFGQPLPYPGVYAVTDASAMVPPRGGPVSAVAVLAVGQGGTVGNITEINDPTDIPRRLVGGDLAKLTEIVMLPSSEEPGATKVYAIRVGAPVAASISTGDGTITALNAGKDGNAVRVKRTITSGVTNLYLSHTTRKNQLQPETYLNLGPAITITLNGTSQTPSIVVATASGATTITLTNNAISLTISSDQFPTLEAVVTEINNSSDWNASLSTPIIGVPTTDLTVGTLTPTGLIYTASIGNKAILYALQNSLIATFTTAGGAATAVDGFLTGGTEGSTPIGSDWDAALALAGTLDVTCIVTGSGNTGYLGAAAGHVTYYNQLTQRKERLLFCGPDKQNSKSALITASKAIAQSIGGKNIVVCGFEPQLVDRQTGKLTAYPSYYFAAMNAGIYAGGAASKSPTYKRVIVSGAAFAYKPDEIADLLESGIVPAQLDDGRWIISQAITSYTTDANVINRKQVGRHIEHYLNKGIRQRLKRFIGETGDQVTVNAVLREARAFLLGETRPLNPTGVLTAGVNPNTGVSVPAFENLKAVMDGFDLVGVQYEAHPVGEIAYITATAYLTPVKIVGRA